jgi:hypothetical protein
VDQKCPCVEQVVIGAKTPRRGSSRDGIGFPAHAHEGGYKHRVLLEIRKGDLSDSSGVQTPNPLSEGFDPIIGNPPLDHWITLMVLQRLAVSFQRKA